MSERIFFRQVTIEAFRAFRDRAVFDLDSSAIVITGSNGTGKTSFFDAVQWLFLGDLERLSSVPRRPKDDYIVNQYRLPGPAVVEAKIVIDSGAAETLEVTLRRSGRQKSSLLEWEQNGQRFLGDEAAARLTEVLLPESSVSMSTALLKSALLQQDVMRDVLEAKESERYQHLNSLLGLEVLSAFEQSARELAKARGDVASDTRSLRNELLAESENVESRLAAVRLRQQQIPAVETARGRLDAVLELIRPRVDVMLDAVSSPESLSDMRDALANAIDVLSSARMRRMALDQELEVLPGSSSRDLEAALGEVAATREALARLEGEYNTIDEEARQLRREVDRLGQLTTIAIPLLTDICPVCQQRIDRGEVERSMLARSRTEPALSESLKRRAELETSMEETRIALSAAQATAARIQLEIQRRQEIEDEFSSLGERVQRTLDAIPAVSVPESAINDLEGTKFEGLIDDLESLQTATEPLELALRSNEEAALERQLSSELNSVSERLRELDERVAQLEASEVRASNLASASGGGSVRIVQDRFAALRPLIRDVYARLDPHPSFKILDLHHDFYRLRGATRPVVRDQEEDLEADPMLIFSSSQANIVALSYFLALGWASGTRNLPFVLMDDPLQSMDDVNVLGFADLCRFARRQRQLIISTHEPRFASLLERKLASREPNQRTQVIRFLAWDRRGPATTSEDVPPQIDVSQPRIATGAAT